MARNFGAVVTMPAWRYSVFQECLYVFIYKLRVVHDRIFWIMNSGVVKYIGECYHVV